MQDYVFVLGRDWRLSLLELVSYFKYNGISFELKDYNEDAALFSLGNVDFEHLIERLGGTVKIAEVVSCGEISKEKIEKSISSFSTNRILISLSDFSKDNFCEKFLLQLKQILREDGFKFSIKKDNSLSKIASKKFLESGIDFVLFKGCIARTIASSNPKLYQKRDKERPNNDFLRSSSIRLSKILINLSGARAGQSILDPFCGLGIILEEGLFLGFNVVGIDLDKKVCKRADENLRFFCSKYSLKNKFRIIHFDSRNIHKALRSDDFDVIVTEPYLGPYIKKTYSIYEAKKISHELEVLYEKFLESLGRFIRSQRVVILFSKFMTKQNTIVGPNMSHLLSKHGFFAQDIFNKIKLPITYSNPNNKIIREIYVLQKYRNV